MTPDSRLSFHDGHTIPRLGFGLWQVEQADQVTETALALGYRLIDGAAIYGNEAGMGQGIAAAGLPRAQIFVTTKVWNDRQGLQATRRSVLESLDRLRLDRLDLCLIHWPCPQRNLFVQAWQALIALRDEGVVTSIGVSNFDAGQIDRLTHETGVTPVLNQIELHLRLPQAALRAAHAARGIVTQSWSPLGRGLDLEHPDLCAIAARLGRSPAQVILRWHLEAGLSVIPRSSRRAGLAENLALFDFALSPQDQLVLAALDRGQRLGPDPATFG
jgi:2,5-diketo-D-gluconate reductase A